MNSPENEDPSLPAKLSHADALRLKTFIRDAEAVIAAERGLNSSSRMKLESLANHQSLSDALFSLALQQLQEADSTTGKRPRYEQAFIDFLDAEFEQLQSNLLSIRAEQKAIEIATTKYQLTPLRAAQIISERAQASSIERIARSEAADYARQFVREQIGARAKLDDSQFALIQERAQQLGMSTEQIEQSTAECLRQNRSRRRSRWLLKLALVFVPLGVLVAIGGWAYSRGWFSPPKATKIPVISGSSELLPDLTPDPSSAVWLSKETIELIGRAERETRLGARLAEKLQHLDAELRISGYRELVQLASEQLATEEPFWAMLLGNLFMEEPDSNAVFAMVDPLIEDLRMRSADIPLQIEKFIQQYRINRLIAMIYYTDSENLVIQSLAHARKQQLAARLRQVTGVSPTGRLLLEYSQQSEPKIAEIQWNELIQNCWSQTGQVAALVEPLTKLTRPRMDIGRLNKLRIRLLLSLLENQPSQWLNLKGPLKEAIESADDLEARQWAALVLSSSHEPLQAFVSPLLVNRLGINPKSFRSDDLLAAIDQFARDDRHQDLQPILQQNARIEIMTVEFLETLTGADDLATPDRIAQLVVLVNLHLAVRHVVLRNSIPSRDSIDRIDRLLKQQNIRLREIVSLPGSQRSVKPVAKPTASDIRRKNEALQKISSPASDQRDARIRYLGELEEIADRFDDLSYEESKALARYFLGAESDQELLNIQRRLSSFNQWPNLALAIADQIGEMESPRDRALTIARVFFQSEFDQGTSSEDWRRILQMEIIERVTEGLSQRTERESANTQSDWLRLEFFMTEQFRQRESIVGLQMPITPGEETNEPALVMLRVIRAALDPLPMRMSVVGQFEQAKHFILSGRYNGLQQTVMIDRFWSELLAAESPTRLSVKDLPENDAVDLLITRIQAEFVPRVLGDELFLAELDLLRQFSAERQTLIRQRLDAR